MKKLIRILLIISILSLTGCDFLRRVAGRPTEKEIEFKKSFLETRRKAIADSLEIVRLEEEKARQKEIERQDSIRGMEELKAMGIHFCYDLRFGSPVEPLGRKYNVVIGVFRQSNTAAQTMVWAIRNGYYPYYIKFAGNVRTVCLCGGDSLGAVSDTVRTALGSGACPKDAWIYVIPDK